MRCFNDAIVQTEQSSTLNFKTKFFLIFNLLLGRPTCKNFEVVKKEQELFSYDLTFF